MNAPATAELPTKANPLTANQTVIRGRIIEIKRNDNGCFTAIALPAPDQYSHPQSVEVRSKSMLGRPGEDVTVRCVVGGFRRQYKDKAGESQYATNVTLNVAED